MARLIVEEGGRTRRFRLNEGTLTIGSGSAATLTLASADVAEVHAELEYRAGRAVLRPRPGVAAITVLGRPVTGGEVVLRPGQSARIGGARLSVEEDGEAPGPSGSPAAATGAQRAAPAAARTRSGRAARADSPAQPAPEAGGPRVRAKRRTMERRFSVPSWLIVVGFLGAAGVTVLLLQNFAEDSAVMGFDPKASQVRIQEKLASASYQGVLEELVKVDAQTDLTPEWKATFEGYRKQALDMRARAEEETRNVTGNAWFDTQLQRYVDGYLKDNGRPEARVLLKRIAIFRKRWPTHPKLEWCERMERRYASIADLASPPTLADVEWEVKTLTWAKPRDYRAAFAAMASFSESAGDLDREAIARLQAEKTKEQEEHFADQIQEAKHLWEDKNEKGQAVEVLVQLVLKLADETMVADAADRLVRMPGVENALAGYKRDRPVDFAELTANERVRAFCKDKGLL